ncbi:MAG TPA: YceI family protein, partial [Polyangiaceae bacterium]|nr:YceI family protein [Polyangiaceae bacterium]
VDHYKRNEGDDMSTQQWNIDTGHSSIHFAVRHLVISRVRGAFDRWRGTVDYDARNPEASKVSVQIDSASIDTREPKRDEHLRSADFLDVEHHPALTFQSTGVEPLARNRFRLTGDFSMHGVTRMIELDVELLGESKDPWGNQRLGFQALQRRPAVIPDRAA